MVSNTFSMELFSHLIPRNSRISWSVCTSYVVSWITTSEHERRFGLDQESGRDVILCKASSEPKWAYTRFMSNRKKATLLGMFTKFWFFQINCHFFMLSVFFESMEYVTHHNDKIFLNRSPLFDPPLKLFASHSPQSKHFERELENR